MTKANEPAYPMFDSNGECIDQSAMGLTKRELFAAMAMQGILANPNLVAVDQEGNAFKRASIKEYALQEADFLIKALEGKGE